jgi:N,N'-diacetyllegionaminate synthase
MPVLIIAEAGVNHNGAMQMAKTLIDAAVEAKVDFVKFQTFVPEKLVSKFAQKADYQKANTGNNSDSQLDMLKQLALNEADHKELIEYCKQKNIKFLSTAFDLESIDLLVKLGITLGKIPSGEITNYPYLVKMAKSFPDLILSTGMSTLQDIENAMTVLINNGADKKRITVLHCNTEYPTPMEDVNLKAMLLIGEQLNVNIGYSDHTLGIEVPLAAVALGATVIEKHFTIDTNLPGPDHKASLMPIQLKQMVDGIRNLEKALGKKEKIVSNSEQKNTSIARKSIVAKVAILKGDAFTEDNITVKRPGNGINPMKWLQVIGKNAPRNFEEDELIEL